MEPMINGTAYSWSQIEIRFNNIVQPLSGVSAIEYMDTQKTELNSGANDLPISRGFGNVVATASITLHMDDIEQIRASIPSGRLSELGQFDMVITFEHPESSKNVVHTIKNCYINENGMSVNQDDTLIERQYNLNPTHILWTQGLILGLGRA